MTFWWYVQCDIAGVFVFHVLGQGARSSSVRGRAFSEWAYVVVLFTRAHGTVLQENMPVVYR